MRNINIVENLAKGIKILIYGFGWLIILTLAVGIVTLGYHYAPWIISRFPDFGLNWGQIIFIVISAMIALGSMTRTTPTS